MPTYDYVCDACGHALEIYQSITDAPKKKCPRCGKSKLARRIGAGAGFIFKGAGFHKTDYRSESYKAGEKADTSAATAASSTSDAAAASKSDAPAKDAPKSDAKPDSKSTSKPESKSAPKPASDSKPKKSKSD